MNLQVANLVQFSLDYRYLFLKTNPGSASDIDLLYTYFQYRIIGFLYYSRCFSSNIMSSNLTRIDFLSWEGFKPTLPYDRRAPQTTEADTFVTKLSGSTLAMQLVKLVQFSFEYKCS